MLCNISLTLQLRNKCLKEGQSLAKGHTLGGGGRSLRTGTPEPHCCGRGSPLTGLICPVIFFFSVFLGLHLRHMEFPKLGVELELQLLIYPTATATQDP